MMIYIACRFDIREIFVAEKKTFDKSRNTLYTRIWNNSIPPISDNCTSMFTFIAEIERAPMELPAMWYAASICDYNRGVKLLGIDAVARDRIQFLFPINFKKLNLITHNILLYQLYTQLCFAFLTSMISIDDLKISLNKASILVAFTVKRSIFLVILDLEKFLDDYKIDLKSTSTLELVPSIGSYLRRNEVRGATSLRVLSAKICECVRETNTLGTTVQRRVQGVVFEALSS